MRGPIHRKYFDFAIGVCGISAKMFIFGVGCPQMGCLGQIRMDCRDSTDVLQEIQSVCHVPNTSKYIWSNVVKNSLYLLLNPLISEHLVDSEWDSGFETLWFWSLSLFSCRGGKCRGCRLSTFSDLPPHHSQHHSLELSASHNRFYLHHFLGTISLCSLRCKF